MHSLPILLYSFSYQLWDDMNKNEMYWPTVRLLFVLCVRNSCVVCVTCVSDHAPLLIFID
jgi:hypothetical protein